MFNPENPSLCSESKDVSRHIAKDVKMFVYSAQCSFSVQEKGSKGGVSP
jgi:hypothetical protein